MTEAVPEVKEHSFSISFGGETQVVQGRSEAVQLAKSLSRENSQRVSLERDDGMVMMQFNNGQLDSFVFETRDRRGN